MIYESLLVPSEQPVTLREIKRALLTYDRVYLIDPSDRDIIPANSLMMAISPILIPIGISHGPVRPLGKIPAYDDEFSKVIDEIRPAIDSNLIKIISTYDQSITTTFSIGSVPTGNYPLNIKFIFWLYRKMANDQNFLSAALDDLSVLGKIENENAIADLILPGEGDGGINNHPALSQLQGYSAGKISIEQATNLARSRIAAFIKYAGYCEFKNMIPLFPDGVYGKIISQLIANTKKILTYQPDPFWQQRLQVLDLCYSEYLPPEHLDKISIKDILKLRSKAWGKQATAREKLLKAIFELTTEIGNQPDFYDKARIKISEYYKKSRALLAERAILGLKIVCDLGKFILPGGGLFTVISQFQSPVTSMAATLTIGGWYALDKAKEYGPEFIKLKEAEHDLKRGAGFAINSFFSKLK